MALHSQAMLAGFNVPTHLSPFAGSEQGNSIIVIDTVVGVSMFIDTLEKDWVCTYPEIFFDIEGANLSRHGTMSVFSVFIPKQRRTYLIHVATLGEAAFNTPGTKDHPQRYGKWTLKNALEAKSYPKVCFDVRNDNDALFGLFGIELEGVIDLQLLELASRNTGEYENGLFVNGLSRCIMHATTVAPSQKQAWKAVKETGIRMFAPDKGGSFSVFERLPMPPAIVQYCANDVKFLPNLLDLYFPMLDHFWRFEIRKKTTLRLVRSREPEYIASGPHKTKSPWGAEAVELLRNIQDIFIKEHELCGDVLDGNDIWRQRSEIGDKKIVTSHHSVTSL